MEKSVSSETHGSWDWKTVGKDKILVKRITPEVNEIIDITGDYWSAGIIENTKKDVKFYSSKGELDLPASRFFMYLPPRSILKLSIKADSVNYILGSKKPILNLLNDQALIYECTEDLQHNYYENLDSLESKISNPVSIGWSTGKSAVAGRIKDIIDKNYRSSITLTEVAEKLNISTYNLTRQFKKEYSISPLDYLTNLRINTIAVNMLFYGREKNLSEVAYEFGFNDISRFNKQFKKMFNTVPKGLKQ